MSSKLLMVIMRSILVFRDPNLPVELPVTWLSYSSTTLPYMEISRHLSQESLKQGYRSKYAQFWREIVPQVLNMYNACKTAGDSLSKYFGREQVEYCDRMP